MLQTLLVAAIVAGAAVYAVWAVVPGPTRLAVARKLGAWGRAPGRPGWIARTTTSIERTAAERQGGCSGCSPARPAEPKDRQQSRH